MRTYQDFCRARSPVERTEKRPGDLVLASREIVTVPGLKVVEMRGRRSRPLDQLASEGSV